jgi:uncharacterized protein YecE (DUF72 family)
MGIKHQGGNHPIRVGLAGWSYKDWEGIVYPPHGSKFDHLAYLADYFDTIEVNSSFYRIPPPTHSKSWVRRVESNPKFQFTAKLFRGFTHEKTEASEADVTAFRNFLDPLAEAKRLGALLVQYPWSTKASPEDLDAIRRTLDTFASYPLALEVRHASFQNEDFLRDLADRNVCFVNIDQPLFSDSVKPSGDVTGGVSYIRLHGRNYKKWFAHEESWERYDYLYSKEELEPWVERAEEMSKSSEVYVITNNHFRGQAAVNAIEIKRGLKQDADVPGQLAETYPDRNL